MKTILIYLCLSFMASAVLANTIVIDNKTNYPTQGKPGKIAVQWATSAEVTQKANKALMNGTTLDSSSLMILSQKGQIQLSAPNHTQYFRIVVWSTNKERPDLLTNWVDIVPNKTYSLNQDQLVPAILMSGSGC